MAGIRQAHNIASEVGQIDQAFEKQYGNVSLSANGRADALTESERATAAEQGRIQRERFLTPGSGYQPGNAQMFKNGNN